MLEVILTKGLPGSGKTTYAKKMVDTFPNAYKRVNKDDLRSMLDNGRHSEDAEKFILDVRDAIILKALESGRHVIVDDTNLSDKHLNRISELVKGKATVRIQDFTDVPLKTCIKNDLKRCASVGEEVITKMYNTHLKPKCAEPPAYNSELPDAIICDLDGTLCLMNGRNPYDASTCDQDLVNKAVLNIIEDYFDRSYGVVIFVSGREDKFLPQTKAWFAKNYPVDYPLYMRKTGDTRKDQIIKKEIYEEHIKDKYNVLFVLDDRNRVVEMWRSLGLTCLQVADGNF